MDDWKRWRERGRKDLAIAEEMFTKQDYEHAAYMTQQALEKHVKAVWMVGGMGQPKDLSHDIVGHFVDKIQKDLKECEFSSNTMSKDEVEKMMQDVGRIVEDMQCHRSTRDALWKHSLGIEVTNVSKRFMKSVKVADEFLKEFKTYEHKIQIVRKQTKSKAKSYAEKPAFVKQAQIKTTTVMSIVCNMELIIKTIPHYIYGRYPSRVKWGNGERNASDLYVECKSGLRTLMDDVGKTCVYLHDVAKDLDTLCGK